jgi:hypothetical protein
MASNRGSQTPLIFRESSANTTNVSDAQPCWFDALEAAVATGEVNRCICGFDQGE